MSIFDSDSTPPQSEQAPVPSSRTCLPARYALKSMAYRFVPRLSLSSSVKYQGPAPVVHDGNPVGATDVWMKTKFPRDRLSDSWVIVVLVTVPAARDAVENTNMVQTAVSHSAICSLGPRIFMCGQRVLM
jgi:hypothetical protein